jgi:hypothetical protein
MNVKVEAGPMMSATNVEIVEAIVKTQLNIAPMKTYSYEQSACLSFTPITVNGHSISAVNPEFVEGGMATLIAA